MNLRKAAQPSLARYVEALREQNCMACGYKTQTLHHIVGGSAQEKLGCRGNRKHSDWLQIPLCDNHHQGRQGIHTIGVSLWEIRYGDQTDMIDQLCERFQLDLWRLAEKPSKIIKHKGVSML